MVHDVRARSSASATPDYVPPESSHASPAVAGASSSHNAAAHNLASNGSAASTSRSSAKARPKARKPSLDPEAQAALERRRQEQLDADDFFTRKTALTFAKRRPVQKKSANNSAGTASTSASVARAANGMRNNASLSPGPSRSKGKERAIVIELDDDEDESSGSSSDGSESDGNESDPYNTMIPKALVKPKSHKKKVQPEVRKSSPRKRVEPDLESDSSSSSSALSFSSASSSKLTRKDKQISKKTKTATDKPQARKERSLSPIETVDSYALAHALHDARRRNHTVQSLQADNIAEDLQFDAGVSETGTLGVRNSAMSPALDDQPERERTRSVSVAGESAVGTRSAKFSLTPLPEAKPLTEEEYEVKFGSVVNIKVEMVYDPRLPVTDLNRELVRKYESPVIVKTRERETFHRLFEAISNFKSVPRDDLTFTYKGKVVYKSGSPSAVKIISNATFRGYTKDVHNYVKQHGESVVERHRSQSRAPSTSDAQAVGHGNSNSSSSIPSTANLVDNALPPASNNAAPASPEGQPAALRLTIRGGPDQKVGLAVPITKTVLSVIKAFLRKFSIDQDKAGQCKLLFDGEELEHGTQLKDTEVEDEDTLDVKVPA